MPEIPLDEGGRPDLSALAEPSTRIQPVWKEALTSCAAVIVANGALDLSASPELAEAVRGPAAGVLGLHAIAGSGGLSRPAARFRRHHASLPARLDSCRTTPNSAAAAEACALSGRSRAPGLEDSAG